MLVHASVGPETAAIALARVFRCKQGLVQLPVLAYSPDGAGPGSGAKTGPQRPNLWDTWIREPPPVPAN